MATSPASLQATLVGASRRSTPAAPAGSGTRAAACLLRHCQHRVAAAARSVAGSSSSGGETASAASLAPPPAFQPESPSPQASAAALVPPGAGGAATAAAAAAVLLLGAAGPALALDIHTEPSNALSLPTWAVHTSSVIEWVTAMGLMWRYGEVSGNPRWKGMAWGMLPCLGSAMCACTWHFFYNSPDLQFLVALQAGLTVVGNFTCWWAAYRIYQWAQQQQGA